MVRAVRLKSKIRSSASSSYSSLRVDLSISRYVPVSPSSDLSRLSSNVTFNLRSGSIWMKRQRVKAKMKSGTATLISY